MDIVEVFDEGAGGLPGAVVSRRAVVAGMALAAMGLSGCGMGADDAGGSSVFADGSTGVVDVGSADADSVDVAEEGSELSALHVDGTQLVDADGAAAACSTYCDQFGVPTSTTASGAFSRMCGSTSSA